MKYDSNIEKFEVHNVAYNLDTKTFTRWPIAILKIPERTLSVSLYKWYVLDGTNRGYFLAFLKLSPEESQVNADIKKKVDCIQNMHNELGETFIKNLEQGISENDDIIYFRWYINVWRQVKKQKKKWIYIDEKPSKDEPCCIERILYN
uniref:Uncharacterized protein n=1 Tax=viral metagenome TaxID=1070528 RepID=A0A6C0FBJ6_9ZZZZ|tara:strand:+ start:3256 stop:3699 length:444 start_codon:yes stop_codon:yes gene_type:complete